MSKSYIREREGVLYTRDSRVPLESLVWLWRNGHTAEEIQDAYATLKLAEVYGAIAYYLEHQAEVDKQLWEGAVQFNMQRAAAETAEPERYARIRQRLAAARARRSHAQPAS